MTDAKEKTPWIERKGTLSWVHRSLWIACATLALADLFYHKHAVFRIEEFPAFYGILGFLACIVFLFGARELRKVLKRGEDYYDR
jgi:hypothetical protein